MIEWVIERLISLLGPAANAHMLKQQLTDDALQAVCTALNETHLYYRDIDLGQQPSTQREAELVRLWSAAAIPLRHVDRQLASLCQYKAEYWLNPRGWPRDKVKQLGIDLESVKDRYRGLLGTP